MPYIEATAQVNRNEGLRLESIAATARDQYLKAYRERISEYKSRYRPGGPEVLLEVGRSTSYLYRLYRVDLASGAVTPPNFTEVNIEFRPTFTQFRGHFEGITIEVFPFIWNGVEFEVSPPIVDDGQLQKWGLRWIDPSEKATPDSSGLGNYVHSVTEPRTHKGATHFSIDFGSASFESWHELFLVLKKSGANHIKVHSKT